MVGRVAGPKIFLSVGEHSGERIACDLMAEIRRRHAGARFLGVGGELMASQGFELCYDLSRHSIMWFWDAMARMPQLAGAILRLGRLMARERPDAVVAIDSPAFNFHMTRKARRLGIPAFYYVAPQAWAYNHWRVVKLRKMVDHLLVVLPFEVEFFARHGIAATYVGHPLVERLANQALDQRLVERLSARPTLALLPGSRQNEVRLSLPVMLEVARRLRAARGELTVVVSSATPSLDEPVGSMVATSGVAAEVVSGSTPELLAAARRALVTSGTATLETAYFQTPALVLYRQPAFNLFMGRPWMTVDHIALPNLIADEPFLDEYLTAGKPVDEMTARGLEILTNEAVRERIVARQAAVRARLLAEPHASRRAAEEICRVLEVARPAS